MKKFLILFLLIALIGSTIFAITYQVSGADDYSGFKVQGRFLYDKNGEKFIPVGVNKMIIWMDSDGLPSYPEIAKTGANCVRVVWTTDGTAKQLDTALYNCRANFMVPMVELHDATGVWNDLQKCVDYWIRPDVVEVLKKHEEYLLVNIANECGDASVAASDFRSKYSDAVNQMRDAGIRVPLIMDGTDWGKNIDVLQSEGPAIISADPLKNVMFSVHMWWPAAWGYTAQKVKDEIAQSVEMELPLIVGEFGALWEENEQGKIPYETILEECTKNQVGWLAWSWGPGNNPQAFLDMTEDSTYATLHDWGLDVAVSNKYSIKNTAVRPAWLQEELPPLPPPTPLPEGNLALKKPVTVSSVESTTYNGEYAVDGDLNTRWASGNSDPQYLTVDLGKVYDISRVYIRWELAYSTQYKIQVSNDGNNWTDLYTEYNGNGEDDDIEVSGSGRYVRMNGMQRYKTDWGYSIWEFGVYGQGSSTTTSVTTTPSTTTTAVSTTTNQTTTITTATTTQVVTTTPTQTNSQSGSYSVAYSALNDWGSGATCEVIIKNNSTSVINGWTLVWNYSGTQKVINLWNGSYTQSGTEVTVKNAAYNGTISPNGTVSFGFNISYSGTNTKPTEFKLN